MKAAITLAVVVGKFKQNEINNKIYLRIWKFITTFAAK